MTRQDAPGLEVRQYVSGPVYVWVASKPARLAGYQPKTVRLHFPDTPEGRAEMHLRCRVLQRDMLSWISGHKQKPVLSPAGTISWLADLYTTDEDSPYRDLRPATKTSYDESLKIVRHSVGAAKLVNITGRDIRRWHREWSRDGANLRRAAGCITVLRIITSYGVTMRDGPSREVREILSNMTFSGNPKRTVRMTFAQSAAVRRAAHAAGRPEIALAVAIQFEIGLRQKDVIGEWVRDDEATSGIVDGPGTRTPVRQMYLKKRPHKWAWGLTWSHISADMILAKPTSKSNGNQVAEHNLKLHPEVMAEIAHVPLDRRIGPVIVNPSTGLPYHKKEFGRRFRALARAAGVPDDVWNMDSRAGAISEAYEAGAQPADVMKAATHTQIATSMRYNRGALEQTSRVAQLRVKRRGI